MAAVSSNSFSSLASLNVAGNSYDIYRLDALARRSIGHVDQLPFSLKVLLENLLRCEDGRFVKPADVEALAEWKPNDDARKEINFMPARVLLQDFTGVPAIVDLAAMRVAMREMGGDPKKINPLLPAELVIDHSVQVDSFGKSRLYLDQFSDGISAQCGALRFPALGPARISKFSSGAARHRICHQVNLEYLARVVYDAPRNGKQVAYPDSLVGTDSHTTMVNSLGVFGWGVGGIEAEAAMLGQPLSLVIPDVVGFKLHGRLPAGSTATDLVLVVTQMLRTKGVVGKFVEFYGTGLSSLSLPDRATIANMAPEYGATMGFFPVDSETLNYLRFTGREKLSRHARGGVHQRTRPLPHGRNSRSNLFGYARTRSCFRGADARRAKAAARPCPTPQREAGIRKKHAGTGFKASAR